MSISKKISIKDLPQLQQINNGDYLIVESSDGTYILDYENLILGPENTTITTAVDQLATDIADVSASVDAQIVALSSEIYTNLKRTYTGKATVLVDTGTRQTVLLSPRPPSDLPEITASDIIISPANVDACKYPAIVSYVDNTDDAKGLITVTVPFTKTSYAITGAITTGLTNSTMMGSDSLSGYTVDELIAGTYVYVSQAGQETPFSIAITNEDVSAEQLGVAPQYNLLVHKFY